MKLEGRFEIVTNNSSAGKKITGMWFKNIEWKNDNKKLNHVF